VKAGEEGLARRRGTFPLTVIGIIESRLQSTERAPRQGSEGAPDAWLVLDAAYAPGLTGIAAGHELIVVTWLHRACRDVLEVYPRDDPTKTIMGVFGTRSSHRPNPLGLHRVTVREIAGTRLRIGPIEAIDGTPVVDVKPVLGDADG
jgi:tRNA-Thr(GGU) m(6)t(6)A37 methyltransferase TsaA